MQEYILYNVILSTNTRCQVDYFDDTILIFLRQLTYDYFIGPYINFNLVAYENELKLVNLP